MHNTGLNNQNIKPFSNFKKENREQGDASFLFNVWKYCHSLKIMVNGSISIVLSGKKMADVKTLFANISLGDSIENPTFL